MVRELRAADMVGALALLRERPMQNVFLEHVVLQGTLGRIPGLFGWESGGRLRGLLVVGPQGGTALEATQAHRDEVCSDFAAFAAELAMRPRHIIGHEDLTGAFWSAYEAKADPVIWTRREPFYALRELMPNSGNAEIQVAPAEASDLDEIVQNSRQQHTEDLKDDRYAADPEGFVARHRADLRAGRWVVARSRGRIGFQVHVGARSGTAVQVGGVFTPLELRNRGWAKRGMRALSARLLRTHPAVCLFCDEENAAARRVYEHVGFEVAFHHQSWLLEHSPADRSRWL